MEFINEQSDLGPQERPRRIRMIALEGFLLSVSLISGLGFVWSLSQPQQPNLLLMLAMGLLFVASLVFAVRLIIDPDMVRARQTDSILDLASKTLACMQKGLSMEAAEQVCHLLLPASSAIAVALTNKELVLGYAGVNQVDTRGGSPIKTAATHTTIDEGVTQILLSPAEIGFPQGSSIIKAAIIVPLTVSGQTIGTLKFYFKSARSINEAQISVAEGFGELLSTQLASIELEEQTKLATSMELKALQSQINPHFLFNTINTIASLIRTDPERARVLLREFAVFYRRILENSCDLIELDRELDQVKRYFNFELARFGDDRLSLSIHQDDFLDEYFIPAFMIQPLVENAVRHAMPSEGKLTITISCATQDDDLLISVKDDGRGMTEDARLNILHTSSSGLGMAVKNIKERIRGFYGPKSYMDIKTELGCGTEVVLVLKGAAHIYPNDFDE